MGRARWGSLSRDQIVEAALRSIKRVGYDRVTIRGIAAEIGVAPMSLYRHVKDKDDLLDEVVDRLLVRAWRPQSDPAEWKAWTVEAADKLRRFLVAQPAALHVYLSHPVASPTAVARTEAVCEVLAGALGGQEAAWRAYAAIQTYTVGFAALEASRAASPGGTGGGELARRLAAFTSPEQFVEGIGYVLAGIEAEARSR